MVVENGLEILVFFIKYNQQIIKNTLLLTMWETGDLALYAFTFYMNRFTNSK